jgi:4'-phosphopantetheinyl transferase
MIHWLVQSADAHPRLAQGIPPDGLLSSAERRHFDSLQSSKRRADWLLGRWTAKKLIQSVLSRQEEAFTMMQLVITNRPSGEPHLQTPLLPLTLSISHSNQHALCAVVEQADWALGVDLEQIAPRTSAFCAQYFTVGEQQRLAHAPEPMRVVLTTALWSAKEAVLKALHVGLRIDTRAVEIEIAATAPPTGWRPLTIAVDPRHFTQAPPPLDGWWRVMDGFVLTMCTEQTDIG